MTDEFVEKIKKNRNEYVSDVYACLDFEKYKSLECLYENGIRDIPTIIYFE